MEFAQLVFLLHNLSRSSFFLFLSFLLFKFYHRQVKKIDKVCSCATLLAHILRFTFMLFKCFCHFNFKFLVGLVNIRFIIVEMVAKKFAWSVSLVANISEHMRLTTYKTNCNFFLRCLHMIIHSTMLQIQLSMASVFFHLLKTVCL